MRLNRLFAFLVGACSSNLGVFRRETRHPTWQGGTLLIIYTLKGGRGEPRGHHTLYSGWKCYRLTLVSQEGRGEE